MKIDIVNYCMLIYLLTLKQCKNDRFDVHGPKENVTLILDTMQSIRRILDNENVIRRSYSSSTEKLNGSLVIHFNISRQILHILTKLQIDQIKFSLRKYSFSNEVSNMLLLKSSLSIHRVNETSFDNQTCQQQNNLNYSNIIYCYEPNTFILSSLTFKPKSQTTLENLVACVKFVNSKNNFELFTETMCFDCSLESDDYEIRNLKHKPLFFILMYMLCTSVLIPVVIWQHFIKKGKQKRLTIMQNKIKESTRRNTQTREVLFPLLFKYEAQSIENFLTPVTDEARHILDNKPWKQSDSALTKESSSNEQVPLRTMSHSMPHLPNILHKEHQEDEAYSLKSLGFCNEDVETIKLMSNSNSDENITIRLRLNDNEIYSRGHVLYESNV